MESKPLHLEVLHGGKPAKFSRFEKVQNEPESTIAAEDLKFFLESWYDECHSRYLSDRTIELRHVLAGRLMWFLQHRNCNACGVVELRAFFAHLRDGHNAAGGRWNIADCSKYRTQHAKSFKPLRPATILTYYRHLSAFFKFLISEGYLQDTPFRRIKPPIFRSDQKDPYTEDEVKAIFAAAKSTSSHYRDYAIVRLLHASGIRATELCGIRVKDINLDNKTVYVLGKGNKRRMVYFGNKCARALWKYKFHRKQHSDLDEDDFFFVSVGHNKDSHMTRSSLKSLMNRLVTAANITRSNAGVHTFRHTFAIESLRAGMDVRALMEILGHTNIETTMIYVKYVGGDMQNQYKKSNPGDRI